jgi:hypothetical protein
MQLSYTILLLMITKTMAYNSVIVIKNDLPQHPITDPSELK